MRRYSVFLFILLLAVLLLTACSTELPPETAPPDGAETPVPTTESAKAPEPAEPDAVYISGLVAAKTETDLFRQSVLIAYGTVRESSAIQVEAASGLQVNYTNYIFELSHVYRGSADGPITVRVEGGIAGGRNEIYEPTAELKDGKEYLLFLFQPNHGGNYYVDDDAYYVLGLNQGTFEPADGGYISQSGATLSEETLLARAEEFPLDPDYFRREFLQNQQSNLDNGFITQEEYDTLVADVDVYAQIVATE